MPQIQHDVTSTMSSSSFMSLVSSGRMTSISSSLLATCFGRFVSASAPPFAARGPESFLFFLGTSPLETDASSSLITSGTSSVPSFAAGPFVDAPFVTEWLPRGWPFRVEVEPLSLVAEAFLM